MSSKLLEAEFVKGGIDLWRKERKELLDHETLKKCGIQIDPLPVGHNAQGASGVYAIKFKIFPPAHIVVTLPPDYSSNKSSAKYNIVGQAPGAKKGKGVEHIINGILYKKAWVRVRDVVQSFLRALHQFRS